MYYHFPSTVINAYSYSYVVKRHKENGSGGNSESTLPYELVPFSENFDVWCFGVVLFKLITGQHLPGMPTNQHDRFTEDESYEIMSCWDWTRQRTEIHSKLDDEMKEPLYAKDLLSQIFATDQYSRPSMSDILKHPFFSDKAKLDNEMMKKFSDEFDKANEKLDQIKKKTLHIEALSVEALSKIDKSTDVLRNAIFEAVTVTTPCCFTILPYKLVRDSNGILKSPVAGKESDGAKEFGVEFSKYDLALKIHEHIPSVSDEAKSFGLALETAVADQNWDYLAKTLEINITGAESLCKSTAKEVVEELKGKWDNPKSQSSNLASYCNSFSQGLTSRTSYLYLIDELAGTPGTSVIEICLFCFTNLPYALISSFRKYCFLKVESGIYPIEIKRQAPWVKKCLPFMQLGVTTLRVASVLANIIPMPFNISAAANVASEKVDNLKAESSVAQYNALQRALDGEQDKSSSESPSALRGKDFNFALFGPEYLWCSGIA